MSTSQQAPSGTGQAAAKQQAAPSKAKPKRKAKAKKPKGGRKRNIPATAQAIVPLELPNKKHLPESVQSTLSACNTQEQLFVIAYCTRARGNATLAMQLSGYAGSYPSQASRGSMTVHMPHVRAAIDAWMEAFAMTSAQLTAAIADVAQANIGPFVQRMKDGTLKVKVPDDEAWEAHKHWIKNVECHPTTGKITGIVLHDASAARRDLAKILKLYSDAPIFALSVRMQNMSDEDLLAEYEQLTRGQMEVQPAADTPQVEGPDE